MDLIKYYKSSKGEATKKSGSTAKVKISPSQQATPTVPVQNAGSHSVDLTLDSHIDDAKEIPSDKLLETSSQQATSAVPVQHGGSHLVEPALDSDVEEDDAKEIPSDELRAFMLLLRSTNSSEMMPHVIKFNATQYIQNCNYCKSLNSECKVNPTASRCQLCQTKKRTCSRTEYFKQWMCRHKFKISWTKAEEVVKRGWVLVRNANLVAPEEKTEADQASASAASTGVRTSSRIPVPRVRKEPTGITTSLEVHSRPRKRTLPSGPPRADRKRRKVTLKVRDPESHELKPEPKSEPEFVSVPNPVNGREILPAPQSDRKPTQSNISRFFKMPALESHEPTNIVRARRPDPRTVILSRLAETEKRLDALEARMRTTELGLATRQHVVSELSGVIGQLENNRDLQGATSRLRALHASFLDEETGNVSADGGQDPNFDQIQVDDEQDDNITPDEAFDDLEGLAHVPNGDTSILVEEPPFLDATVDAPTRAFTAVFNDDTSFMIENDPESPILPQGQASDDPVTAT
ncbi:hypothetical protein MSAN_01354300 [Mycena sanguinolenta]|uniref:Uncharacterized protein n=1 Tax=Mycena sanguinolenta TaxID=230812 RepID=A0A8H7D0M5_9AGAR|nr:hypothetical protein MSAN_01354300 [Mycena sanguinolenta]